MAAKDSSLLLSSALCCFESHSSQLWQKREEGIFMVSSVNLFKSNVWENFYGKRNYREGEGVPRFVTVLESKMQSTCTLDSGLLG